MHNERPAGITRPAWPEPSRPAERRHDDRGSVSRMMVKDIERSNPGELVAALVSNGLAPLRAEYLVQNRGADDVLRQIQRVLDQPSGPAAA
jgi:hypothetical protein